MKYRYLNYIIKIILFEMKSGKFEFTPDRQKEKVCSYKSKSPNNKDEFKYFTNYITFSRFTINKNIKIY